MAHVCDELTLQRRDASFFFGDEHNDDRANDDDDRGEAHHRDLEKAPVLNARSDLFARLWRDLNTPVVERCWKADADRELACAKRRAVNNASFFVDYIHATRGC